MESRRSLPESPDDVYVHLAAAQPSQPHLFDHATSLYAFFPNFLYSASCIKGEKILSILLLIFSAVCVVSSVRLLIGIWMDFRDLSIPWIISIIMTTTLDSFYCLYLVFEAEFAVLIILLFSTDIVISVLNVYCVISHLWMYYMSDRGHPVAREIQAPEEQEYRREGSFMPSPGDPVTTHSSTVAEIHYSGKVVRNEDKSLEIELQESPDNHRDGVAWNENLDDLMKDCKEVLNDLIEKMMEGMVEPIK